MYGQANALIENWIKMQDFVQPLKWQVSLMGALTFCISFLVFFA